MNTKFGIEHIERTPDELLLNLVRRAVRYTKLEAAEAPSVIMDQEYKLIYKSIDSFRSMFFAVAGELRLHELDCIKRSSPCLFCGNHINPDPEKEIIDSGCKKNRPMDDDSISKRGKSACIDFDTTDAVLPLSDLQLDEEITNDTYSKAMVAKAFSNFLKVAVALSLTTEAPDVPAH